MLFDEIEVDTVISDGELFINVDQLSSHIHASALSFAKESKEIHDYFGGMTEKERAYISGMIQGMATICIMLLQGKDEHDVNQIETIEDLLKGFNDDV